MFGAAEYIIVDLSQNRLTGTIPDSVCKGPATLQNLRFEMNRLSGLFILLFLLGCVVTREREREREKGNVLFLIQIF